MDMDCVTLGDVEAARERIAGSVVLTPCPESVALSELTGSQVYCKLDYLQRTGSFKERGASHALMLLEPEAAQRGVVAASAGNHALALAYHGRRLGIQVTVVMPVFAPLIKGSTCTALGARVIRHGENFGEARAQAEALGRKHGLTYLHGFDDAAVIAGQGTMGLELLEQVEGLEAVIVPVGGGGLLAGVAVAIKTARPDIRVIGVEPERMPSLKAALASGKAVAIDPQPTLADGLAVGCVGTRALRTLQPLMDELVTVTEGELALAVLRLLELEKAVVEGAGAASLAALLSGKLEALRGRRVALPLCGGNIDPLVLRRVIEHGMAHDDRLSRLEVRISDRPGGLAKLTRLIAEEGVSIQEVRHDRIFAGPDVTTVQAQLVVETRNADHIERVKQRLTDEGYFSQWSELI